jgi:alpha-D-xyloside xylohydrolase
VQKNEHGDGIFSSGLQVWVDAPPAPPPREGVGSDIGKYFGGSTPHVGIHIKNGEGNTLLDMRGWQMAVPNYKDGTSQIDYDRRPTDKAFYTVGATFSAAPDEHDYGLGQNHEGFLDRRGHVLRCAHDYNAPSGQTVCVPFVVTNKGYAILWDNPSRTTVSFGFNGTNQFLSEVGRRVTFLSLQGIMTHSIRASASLRAIRRCYRSQRTATSSASSGTLPRRSCWKWREDIAVAIYR